MSSILPRILPHRHTGLPRNNGPLFALHTWLFPRVRIGYGTRPDGFLKGVWNEQDLNRVIILVSWECGFHQHTLPYKCSLGQIPDSSSRGLGVVFILYEVEHGLAGFILGL